MRRPSHVRDVLSLGLTVVVLTGCSLLWPGFATPDLAAQAPARPAPAISDVDALFSRWNSTTPGCAVGIGGPGRPAVARAYGMADLEHGVQNTAETIFEAGSVSKQFTAAAVLILVRDGKLSLDDDVRKHFPELPDYGTPITIRHLLTHTSGLRDWGSLASIGGWPRGSRVHTHAHALEILSRQRGLNFAPGTRWSYSNSGYNLAAMLVERVSGQSFGAFSKDRLFTPLGLASTSWRDDYTRVVPGRAIAYAPAGGAYRQDMPFENVVGNGGLLTTVGDLLRWSAAYASPASPLDMDLTRLQQTVARLPDGRAFDYAFGLFLRPYKGLDEVQHSGATAGYRAFLTRVPSQQHFSVAVLCNAGDANPTMAAHGVIDLYLPAALRPASAAPAAVPEAAGPSPVVRDTSYRLAPADLAAYVGTYASDEIETTLVVEARGDALVVRRRPNTTLALQPLSRDAFAAGSLGTVKFHRVNGAIRALGVTQDRVWDLRFQKR